MTFWERIAHWTDRLENYNRHLIQAHKTALTGQDGELPYPPNVLLLSYWYKAKRWLGR